jgi:hypothetical protein
LKPKPRFTVRLYLPDHSLIFYAMLYVQRQIKTEILFV